MSQNITHLLKEWSKGDQRALNELTPLVYEELRQQAARYMRKERVGHSLQATALINEAYLRLVDVDRIQLESRAHFFALAARMMRRLLIDAARKRGNDKRGGSIRRVSLDDVAEIADSRLDFAALDDALLKLESIHPRKVQVVELRFFGGFSLQQTADTLKISIDTVKRDWRFAKAWLHRELSEGTTR